MKSNLHYITEDKCQEMIDDAIRRHNRNAGMISMFVGFLILGLSLKVRSTHWSN